jgi:CHASE3 domain sensor protein
MIDTSNETKQSKLKRRIKIMAKSKLVEMNKKIEEGVVSGYKKIEEGVVSGFGKITDKFVDQFLTKEGETVEEAKKRLAAEQDAREGVSGIVSEATDNGTEE